MRHILSQFLSIDGKINIIVRSETFASFKKPVSNEPFSDINKRDNMLLALEDEIFGPLSGFSSDNESILSNLSAVTNISTRSKRSSSSDKRKSESV